MSFRWRLGTAKIAVYLAFLACSRSTEEVEGSANQPLLSLPSPIDGDSGKSTWTGTSHELLLADALVACTLPAETTEATPAPVRTFGDQISDRVFDRVRGLMDVTLANYQDSMGDVVRARRWLRVRNTPTSNGLAMGNWKGSVELTGAFPEAYVLPDADWNPDRVALQEALEVAGVNFCLARTLKEQLGLDSTFLMTKAEQRELYQAARERAQIAMLQLSNLFRALVLAQGAPTAAMDPAIRAASALRQQGAFAAQLSQHARDLSDLILWEIEITEKLSALLMRAASAHDPLPGATILPRDGLQSGSWRQRVLALLYGGNPLSAGEPGVPPVSEAVLPRDGFASGMLQWPNAAEVPAAAPGLWTPQAIRFKAYLERFDTFSLVLKSNAQYGRPSDIDETQTAVWLYRELEAKLRQRACPAGARAAPPADQPWCAAIEPTQIAEAIDLSPQAVPSQNLLTYRVHGFKPSDALQLAKAVVDIMPSLSGTDGFFIGGAVRQAALPGRPNPALIFDKPRFAPRSILELASALGSRGRHRIPTSIDASDPYGTRNLAPLLDGRSTSEAVPLDEIAALGAVPALAAAREALAEPALSAYLGSSPDPRSLIDAAIGKQQVSIRPAERAVYAGGTQIVQPKDWAMRSLWKINVTTDSADPFWSGTLGQYTLYAVVGDPSILHLLADPSSEKLGLRSLDDLTTRGSSSLLLIRPQKTGDVLSGSVYLPPQMPVVFFARRSQTVGGAAQYSYKPLTGSVRLWSDWRYDIGRVGMPLDSQYYAVGGSLIRLAVAATAVMPWDLAEPAVDAFDRPRGFTSALQIDPSAEKESLLAYRDRVVGTARRDADEARAQVESALEHIRTGALEKIDENLERRRELNTTTQLLTHACGTAAGDPSNANNPCHQEFATVEALGSTAEELEAICGSLPEVVDRIEFDWKVSDCDKLANAAADDRARNEMRARCAMASFVSKLDGAVEVAKQVACSQYQNSPSYGVGDGKAGSLAAALLSQHQALAAYRSRVKELRLDGQSLVEAGKRLDNEMALAAGRAEEFESARRNKEVQAFDILGGLIDDYNTAKKDYEGAYSVLAELTDTSAEKLPSSDFDVGEILKEGGRGAIAGLAGAGAAAGAVIGSAVPVVGTLIGGAVGGLVGALSGLLSGPSEEELAKANSAIESTKVRRDNAELAIKRKIEEIGQCPDDITVLYPSVCKCPSCPPAAGSMAALMEFQAKLQNLYTDDARLKANADFAAGVTRIQERISAIQQAAFDLAKTNLGIKNEILDLRLAVLKARFEAEQVAHRGKDRFAVNRLFFGNAMNRAIGKLEQARDSALDARWAVEYSMLLNLSNDDRGNGQVGPPSQWVDQIYDTDLSDLRIVGRSTIPNDPEVVSPDKLRDFVSNLVAFIQGFPGPGKNIAIETNAGQSFMLSPPSPDSAASVGTSWFLECPAGSTCATNGGWCQATSSLRGVCISASTNAPLLPKRLKAIFSLNSRGGLGQAAAGPRVNSRWHRALVNTVIANLVRDADGTQRTAPVKNCSLARPSLRQMCFQAAADELDYSLKHIGPFVALDAGGNWQLLSLGDGYLSLGSSAPTTQYIDPQVSGNPFDPPSLWARLANYKSKGFPVEGWYELTLTAKTDDGGETGQIITDLTILPTIKVLFDSTHWTVQ